MPKLKKGAPRLTRTVRGIQQKRGKGWHTGQIAKAKVFAPGYAQARWYTPSNPPVEVKVPVEHLLHVGFAMAAAVAPERPNARQKDALKKGAIVLSEDDHLQAMDAFAYN